MKHIYIYTSPIYKQNNWYKIGETVNDPKQRVRNQDNSSNPEPLIFIKAWVVPKKITDKKVHAALQKLGFEKIRESREWFELSEEPQKDVFEAISLCTKEFSEYKDDILPISSLPKNHIVPNYTDIWWFSK